MIQSLKQQHLLLRETPWFAMQTWHITTTWIWWQIQYRLRK